MAMPRGMCINTPVRTLREDGYELRHVCFPRKRSGPEAGSNRRGGVSNSGRDGRGSGRVASVDYPSCSALVWFFFTVVCDVACMAATTLLGFLSDQSVRGELHWKRLLLFLMVLSAGCLVTAICHVPGAFLQMTQRLPHAPQTVTPEVTTPSPYPQEPTRLGRSAFCWVAKAVMNRPAQELPSEFYGTVTSPKG